MTQKRVPALTNDGLLDQLCDMLLAKLSERQNGFLPSKQVVAGSSPVSRSSFKKRAFLGQNPPCTGQAQSRNFSVNDSVTSQKSAHHKDITNESQFYHRF